MLDAIQYAGQTMRDSDIIEALARATSSANSRNAVFNRAAAGLSAAVMDRWRQQIEAISRDAETSRTQAARHS